MNGKVNSVDECQCMCANKAELLAEDIDCLHKNLDDNGIPRVDGNGNSYSMWGRVQIYKCLDVKETE